MYFLRISPCFFIRTPGTNARCLRFSENRCKANWPPLPRTQYQRRHISASNLGTRITDPIVEKLNEAFASKDSVKTKNALKVSIDRFMEGLL